MAFYGNLRPIRQAFKYALLHRFLSRQAGPRHFKPSFILQNSLKRTDLTSTYISSANFHHLAEHTLNNNAMYYMNIDNWMHGTVKTNPIAYRTKVNYTDILWPIEKILKEIKIKRSDRIFAKSMDYKKIDGLDIKEIHFTEGNSDKLLKETEAEKKQQLPKVPEGEKKL